MEKAIKRAIEGGLKEGTNWKFIKANQYWAVWLNGNGNEVTIATEKYLLDPLFWKALGTAEGFNPTAKILMCTGCGVALRWNEEPTIDGKHGGKNGCGSDIYEYQGQWLIEWHRFIDQLAEGKDIESFFNGILK